MHGGRTVRQLFTLCPQTGSKEINATLISSPSIRYKVSAHVMPQPAFTVGFPRSRVFGNTLLDMEFCLLGDSEPSKVDNDDE